MEASCVCTLFRCVEVEGVVVLEIILENLSHPHILCIKKTPNQTQKDEVVYS